MFEAGLRGVPLSESLHVGGACGSVALFAVLGAPQTFAESILCYSPRVCGREAVRTPPVTTLPWEEQVATKIGPKNQTPDTQSDNKESARIEDDKKQIEAITYAK